MHFSNTIFSRYYCWSAPSPWHVTWPIYGLAAPINTIRVQLLHQLLMEELHTDSIDGGHEASYGARSRARERAYSNSVI